MSSHIPPTRDLTGPNESRPDRPVAAAGADGAGPSAQSDLEMLVRKMQAGDREAAATFITRYGSRVRRRVRGKLGPAMRRLFDSEEILSTVGRRLDLYVRDGRLEADGESQLWTLIFRMADNALVDKIRVFRRLEEVESSDSEFARHLLQRLRRADREQPEGAEIVIEEALRIVPNEVDRDVLRLWLSGRSTNDIAEELGITQVAVSKRWQKIKGRLRIHLVGGPDQ